MFNILYTTEIYMTTGSFQTIEMITAKKRKACPQLT